MSLSKQLMLLVSLLFLLIFAGTFTVSVNGMRDYLQVESKVHAQDTATSLALSLSPHLANPQDAILETMVKAIYDMGYYQQIRLADLDDRTLVRFANTRVPKAVPQWFINWLPMATATADSDVSSGWNLAGRLYVTMNPGRAYLKLYRQMTSAFYYSLAALIISLLLLFIVLRFTLQPLKTIDRVARQIATGRFCTVENLPWTDEVRNIAVSMNLMSGKIEGVITGLNQKLDVLSRRLLLDEVTGLYRKSAFEADLEQLFHCGGGGYVLSLRISAFAERARDHADSATDAFLKRFADVLSQCASEQDPSARAYRFYGSEFALLMPGLDGSTVEPFAQHLRQRLTWVGEEMQQPDIVHIGIAPFNPRGTTEGILAAANDACEQATLIGVNSYVICPDIEQGKRAERWREMVFDIVDHGLYVVTYGGQVNTLQGNQLIIEEAFTQAFDEAGKPIPVGLFVSMAEKFERIVELDMGVTRNVMARLDAGSVTHGIAVNLSMVTLKSAEFRVWLIELLRQNAAVAEQLIFCVSAYSAAKDIGLFRGFTEFAHRQGAQIMLKRYDTQYLSVETLTSLRPDYVRIARDWTRGIISDTGKRLWVETMKEVGTLLEVAIIAEQVQSEGDLAVIIDIGLAGASR